MFKEGVLAYPIPKNESVEEDKTERNKNETSELKMDSVLSFHKIKKVAEEGIIAGLEMNHQAFRAFDGFLDKTQSAINVAIPAASQAVTGFILPAHLDRVFNKGVEYTTKGGTFIAKGVAKSLPQIMTFGLPKWLEAYRIEKAISNGMERYEEIESGADLSVSGLIEGIKDEKVKNGLTEYFNLRKKLASIKEGGTEGREEEIKNISLSLANFELRYKDNQDFSSLKGILENGIKFFESNSTLIEDISDNLAEDMIKRVENFYKDKFGKLSDVVVVKGGFLEIFKSGGNHRDELKKKIKDRLKRVVVADIEKEDVKKELEIIHKNLISSFGLYKEIAKAGTYTILRLIPIPVIEASDAGYLKEAKEAFKEGYENYNPAGEAGMEQSAGIVASIKNGADLGYGKGEFNFLPSLKGYYDFAGDLAKKTTLQIPEEIGEGMREGYEGIKKWAWDKTLGPVDEYWDAKKEALSNTWIGKGVLEVSDVLFGKAGTIEEGVGDDVGFFDGLRKKLSFSKDVDLKNIPTMNAH